MAIMDDIWRPGKALATASQLRAMVVRCGERWKAPKAFALARVQVVYNPHLRTTLGRAVLQAHRAELNTRLLLAHPDQLVATVVHELAHVLVFIRHRRARPHGQQWRALMVAAGVEPTVRHDLPAARVLRRRRYHYVHTCSQCGSRFVAGRPRYDCHCRACGPGMEWQILRVLDAPRGRELISEMVPGLRWEVRQ